MEKISSLGFQKIAHLITAVDCQPMFDGGILINVLGQLKVLVVSFTSPKLPGSIRFLLVSKKRDKRK
jgi:hypothetical protein